MELDRRCSKKKILVVIDDVDDDASQLDLLLTWREGLHPDSTFIITSRNIGLLEQRCDAVEEVLPLECGLDKQLFSAHAFAAEEPEPAMAAPVDEVVSSCCGLPLTLEARMTSLDVSLVLLIQ